MSLKLEKTVGYGYTVHNTNSLADFEQWVRLVKGKTETTIYRGQRRDYPLLPNICRKTNPSLLLEYERALLSLFKKKAPPCLQMVPENDWEWLVVAQHHGLLTRLLDWTYNPYVALWFALEKAVKDDSQPVVWVMNPLKTDVIETPDSGSPFSGTRTKIFKSSFQIPRAKAQKGCFVLFKHTEKSSKGFVSIERNKILQERIAKINIQVGSVNTILSQLSAMGYDKSHLFPDINEVAKEVQNRILNNGCIPYK